MEITQQYEALSRLPASSQQGALDASGLSGAGKEGVGRQGKN